MQDHNPYTAPEAVVSDVEIDELRLAGRGERLGAAIIDGLIMLVIVLPMMYMGGYFSGMLSGQQPGIGTQLMWAAIGFGVFVVVQGYPLNETGQTWGKKLLKMRIVDMDGRKPPFAKLVLARYGSTQLISAIPFLGGLYALVDVLFIFSESRRCLHDRIAGTRVVVAD